jgi:hypothetical protein
VVAEAVPKMLTPVAVAVAVAAPPSVEFNVECSDLGASNHCGSKPSPAAVIVAAVVAAVVAVVAEWSPRLRPNPNSGAHIGPALLLLPPSLLLPLPLALDARRTAAWARAGAAAGLCFYILNCVIVYFLFIWGRSKYL